jgi:pimeloyl-ACP methyl ester carboxylesterase
MGVNRRQFAVAILAAAGTASAVALLGACADGPDASPPAVSIDEGSFVDINGVEQWIAIRGGDVRNPVLLYLQGGPGIGAAFMVPVFTDWEKDFTIVLWDQPGGGETDVRNFATGRGNMNRERFIADGLAVAEHVRKQLGKRRLVLVGNSWGTHLGIEMVKRRPEMFSAYVGIAQVTGKRGSLMGYKMALDSARARKDAAAVAALEKVGPPPYAKVEDFFVRQQFSNPPGEPVTPAETAATTAMNKLFTVPAPPDAHWIGHQKAPPGYNGTEAFLSTQRALFAEEGSWDIRDLGSDWKVPILVIQGENDWNAPAVLAREWVDEIKAPKKAFELIPGATHSLMAYHDDLLRLIRLHILPLVAKTL